MKQLALAIVLIAPPAAAWACDIPQDWTVMTARQPGTVIAAVKLPELPIQTGKLFDIDVMICADEVNALDLHFDALMPAHKHGMNYRPEIEDLANGQFRVSGLFFHMPGQWKFTMDLNAKSQQDFYLDVAAR